MLSKGELKARRKEQVILRLLKGEKLSTVLADYPDLGLKPCSWSRLKNRYKKQGIRALIDKRKGTAYKLRPEIQEFIISQKRSVPQINSKALIARIKEKYNVSLSNSYINQLLREAGISNPRGRRKGKQPLILSECPGKDHISAEVFDKPFIAMLNPVQYKKLELIDLKIRRPFIERELTKLGIKMKIADAELSLSHPISKKALKLRIALVLAKGSNILAIITNIGPFDLPETAHIVELYFKHYPQQLSSVKNP
jgi:transposase